MRGETHQWARTIVQSCHTSDNCIDERYYFCATTAFAIDVLNILEGALYARSLTIR